MPAELIAVGIVVGKKTIENIVSDLYELAKKSGNLQLRKWKTTEQIDRITKQVKQLRLVKTIFQTEKEVDLLHFYHPSKLLIDRTPKVIKNLSDIDSERSVLIQGTAGQGKSIFLRYLASAEFSSAQRVPVFIELRRYRSTKTLHSMLLEELHVLGFEMTGQVFEFFASQGKIVLLLDGFDEVKEEDREELLNGIENMIRVFRLLRVVLSSRPDSGAEHSTLLRSYDLMPLAAGEYVDVVRRMAINETTANALIKGLERNAAVVPLLTTPLMVALLMVRYTMKQSIPETKLAFYDALFDLLLRRHDKSKAGYSRPRKSKLGDSSLFAFFNALAFLTRQAGATSFSKMELIDFGNEALSVTRLQDDADDVLEDIVKITCLIVEDGDERQYIHKSVQEYHAALFVKTRPESVAIEFYSAMREHWKSWQGELSFLSGMDKYRFLKWFYLDELRLPFEVGSVVMRDSVTRDLIKNVYGMNEVTFVNGKISRTRLSGNWEILRYMEDLDTQDRHMRLSSVIKLSDLEGKRDLPEPGKGEADPLTVSIAELLDYEPAAKKIESIYRPECEVMQQKLRNAEAYVADEEGTGRVFRFSIQKKKDDPEKYSSFRST